MKQSPMKVHVVTSCPLHGITTIEGVFSSRGLAEAFVSGFHESYNMDIEERTVDGSVPPSDSVVTSVDHVAGVVTFATSDPANRKPCSRCRGYTDSVARVAFHDIGCHMKSTL